MPPITRTVNKETDHHIGISGQALTTIGTNDSFKRQRYKVRFKFGGWGACVAKKLTRVFPSQLREITSEPVGQTNTSSMLPCKIKGF